MRRVLILLIGLAIAHTGHSSIIVLNGLTHEYTVRPGETVRGTIQVRNISERSQRVNLASKDYSFNAEGQSFYEEPGTLGRSNASWLKYNPNFLDLANNEEGSIRFDISIPEIDSLTGTYWSVLMIEGDAPLDTNILEGGFRIANKVRYAIQIITTIGETGASELVFEAIDISRSDSVHVFAIDVVNTGERMLRPAITIEIFDNEGTSLGTFPAKQRKLFPDTSSRFYIRHAMLVKGSYKAILLADCGETVVFGTNLAFEIKDD